VLLKAWFTKSNALVTGMATKAYQDVIQSDHLQPSDMAHIIERIPMIYAEGWLNN
jgi:hypothetical protein